MESSRLSFFYLVGLFIFSILIGLFAAYIRDKGRLYKLFKEFGFNHSPFENLWDEILFVYEMEGIAPVVIIHYEEESFAGSVHRASFDLDKNERKELILSNTKYRGKDDEEWQDGETSVVYLDLKDVKSISFVNGKKILNSKY